MGDHFRVNGQKRFIVGGTAADYFLVYARTDPKVEPQKGMSCLLVDRGPGVETSYLYGLMGCRGGGASRVVFKDVRVPKENLLGALHGGAAVFDTMMIPERLGTAAMTVGAARPALEMATRYTTKRKAFGQAIQRFQGVSFQVAEAAMLLDASRAMVHTTCLAVEAKIGEGRVRRLVSRDEEVRHRVVPAGRQRRHAGDGGHRLHQRLPRRADLPRSAAGEHLDRDQRGHVDDHGERVVPGVQGARRLAAHARPRA